MAFKCDNCGKGVMTGKQHKHHPGVAGGRWKKRAPVTQKLFRPNLHSVRILINGMHKRMKLCTKCLRIARRNVMEKKASVPQEQATVTA